MRPLLRPVLLVTAALVLAVAAHPRRHRPARRHVGHRRSLHRAGRPAGPPRLSTRPRMPASRRTTSSAPCRPGCGTPRRTTAPGPPCPWPTSSRPGSRPTPPTTPRPTRPSPGPAALAPGDSVMLTARATLAAARHDFTAALRSTGAALRINPYSAAAEAIRSDALTELGRYPEALRAAHRADDLDPGPSTFARLSYQAELRGDLAERDPADAPVAEGGRHQRVVLRLRDLPPRRAGPRGRQARTGRPPLPQRAGRRPDVPARRWPARPASPSPAATWPPPSATTCASCSGSPSPSTSSSWASCTRRPAGRSRPPSSTPWRPPRHGWPPPTGWPPTSRPRCSRPTTAAPAVALTAARAEWDRRHSIHTADALGWALHASGQDRTALRYARQANRLGTRDARLVFHLGAIEAALRLPSAARATCGTRAGWTPGVSPWREAAISTLLGGAAMSRLAVRAGARSSCGALALLVGVPAVASAHPLGNFTVNRYSGVVVVAGVGDRRPRARPGRDPDRAAQPGDRHLRRRHSCPGAELAVVGRPAPAPTPPASLRLTVAVAGCRSRSGRRRRARWPARRGCRRCGSSARCRHRRR